MSEAKPTKHIFYNELAYVLGIVLLATGTALMAFADFGVCNVVAPAYILHLKLSEALPFFSFGMAEYTLQAMLLVIMCLVIRRFKVSYIFSFVTAILYGLSLDGATVLINLLPHESFALKLIYYVFGFLICTLAISFLFHSYVSPEVYELFVREYSVRYSVNINKVKLIYDIVSCIVAVAMSFLFFGWMHFEGIKWGTIICAVVNAPAIAFFSKIIEKHFVFKDGLKYRKFFE